MEGEHHSSSALCERTAAAGPTNGFQINDTTIISPEAPIVAVVSPARKLPETPVGDWKADRELSTSLDSKCRLQVRVVHFGL
ncbi:hypothetical protein CSUB01_05193 [Colletotrichum sublineola]|uniref:Uncharacterized protein n=1 Tax=Colletotrichum sublineola TaxID=1173701 RepID=A0A066XNM5_COLSU|nr:hypothetical protein CSUB01_05193 [Colletotrichum sublineola]